jgi:hypothetical protein
MASTIENLSTDNQSARRGAVVKLNSKALAIILSASVSLGIVACLRVLVPYLNVQLSQPVIISTYPVQDEVGVPNSSRQTVTFNKGMDPRTINAKTLVLSDDHGRIIPARVSCQESNRTAVLDPSAPLHPGTTYRLAAVGGSNGIKDPLGHALANDRAWTFTTGFQSKLPLTQGPGGPILLITSPANGFSQYYAEILRNEGFNEFATIDISQLQEAALKKYEVAVLGEVPLNALQIAVLARWVHAGGELIAMRPDLKLAQAFAFQVTNPSATPDSPLQDAYLAIQPSGPGDGLPHQPIQFHGSLAPYHFSGGVVLATVYRDPATPTPFPAISTTDFGDGRVVLYGYDLARSVVYTRQGNPRWSGMERDGIAPIRSDDLFYGASPSDPQPDWVDPNNIAVPQADVQQRLFANIINLPSTRKMPLPHFWYLPRGLKAAVVLTGDDHGGGGTARRLQSYLAKSPPGCSIQNWECIRATSNIFVGSISSPDANRLVAQGFEIGLHVYTACANWPSHPVPQPDGTVRNEVDRQFADSLYRAQLAVFAARYPGVPSPVSNRIDCVTWGDYDTQPQVELNHGIRLDTNYYFWPPKWVRNRPGLFTGSALPMRFAKRDGTIIDVYQAATQMTDESGQQYPFTIDTLLSNALGPSESYGVLTVNMHNDEPKSPGADAIISSALKRHIPLVSAAQMLRWLDGRNASSFQNLAWSNGQLTFSIEAGEYAAGLETLLPISSGAGALTSLTVNGAVLEYQLRTIAGLNYAAFPARTGKIQATYRQPNATPQKTQR